MVFVIPPRFPLSLLPRPSSLHPLSPFPHPPNTTNKKKTKDRCAPSVEWFLIGVVGEREWRVTNQKNTG